MATSPGMIVDPNAPWWSNLMYGTDAGGGSIGGARVLDGGGVKTDKWGGQSFDARDWDAGALSQFAQANGFGDLWSSGYSTTPYSGEQDSTGSQVMESYSPELLQRLQQYNFHRTGARPGESDRTRHLIATDQNGQSVWGNTYGYSPWYDAPLEAAGVLGGAYLGASALNGGLLGLGGASGGGGGLGAVGAGGGSSAGAITAANVTGTAGLGEAAGAYLAETAGAAGGGLGAAGAVTNPALLESAIGTAGYGASSASAGIPGAGVGGTLAQGGLGMSGAGTSVYDAVISATGSPQLASMAAQGGSGLSEVWSSLSPLQKAQLGSQLGGLAVGAVSGGGSRGSTSTAGQQSAGNLQMQIANQLQGLGTQELTNARQRQGQYDTQFDTLIQRALASQATSDGRSQQVWDEYTNTFLPAARRMADTAANYDTAGRRSAAAAEAVAGVDSQMQRNREAMMRDVTRRGGSLSSGRALTLDAASRFAGAKAAAGADRTARQGIEDRGIALTQGVANYGQGVANLGLSAASQGLQAGNTASGTLQARQGVYNQTLQPALTSLGNAASAAGGAGSTFNGVSQLGMQQQQMDNQGYAGLGSLIGTLGGLYLSDPKTKKVHGKADGAAALRDVERKGVYDYTYKPGLGDGRRHIGRMAGKGDVDTPHGKAIDVVSELGTQRAAIKQLAKEVRRLGLADAEDAQIRSAA